MQKFAERTSPGPMLTSFTPSIMLLLGNSKIQLSLLLTSSFGTPLSSSARRATYLSLSLKGGTERIGFAVGLEIVILTQILSPGRYFCRSNSTVLRRAVIPFISCTNSSYPGGGTIVWDQSDVAPIKNKPNFNKRIFISTLFICTFSRKQPSDHPR